MWSLVGVFGEGVTNLDCLDRLGKLGKEFVVDPRLDKDTTAGATSLSVVPA